MSQCVRPSRWLGLWFCVAVFTVLGAGSGAALRADEVDDAMDDVQIKLRSGRSQEALTLLDDLLRRHADSPLLHFQRCLVLKKLDRFNDAADAIERAVDCMERYKAGGGGRREVLDIQRDLESEADDLLKYRRGVRAEIDKFRDGALGLALDLAEAERAYAALYVLAEVAVVDPASADAVQTQRRGIDAAAVRDFDERQASARGASAAGDPGTVPGNLREAGKAMRSRQFGEARMFALAALEADPGNLEARVVLAEALFGMERGTDALEAALLAVDTPKEDNRDTHALHARAVSQVRKAAEGLYRFLGLRERAANVLVRLQKQADREKRPYDTAWIGGVARRLAPGEPVVGQTFGTEGRSRVAGGAGGGAGFISLMDRAERWQWRNKGPDTGFVDGELRMTDNRTPYMLEAIPQGIELGQNFTLRFGMMLDIAPGSDPSMFVVFNTDPVSQQDDNALIFIPQGRHHIGFSRRAPQGSWTISETQSFPPDKPRSGNWHDYEVRWTDADKHLVVSMDGAPVFDYTLRPNDRLHGAFSLGVGDLREARIRGVMVRNE